MLNSVSDGNNFTSVFNCEEVPDSDVAVSLESSGRLSLLGGFFKGEDLGDSDCFTFDWGDLRELFFFDDWSDFDCWAVSDDLRLFRESETKFYFIFTTRYLLNKYCNVNMYMLLSYSICCLPSHTILIYACNWINMF